MKKNIVSVILIFVVFLGLLYAIFFKDTALSAILMGVAYILVSIGWMLQSSLNENTNKVVRLVVNIFTWLAGLFSTAVVLYNFGQLAPPT